MSDTQQSIDKKIDVSDVDWNKLSVEEFHSLSSVFAERDKMLKETKKRKVRDNSDKKALLLNGRTFIVKSTTITKLRNMKNHRSKEKLIEEIIKTAEEIPQL